MIAVPVGQELPRALQGLAPQYVKSPGLGPLMGWCPIGILQDLFYDVLIDRAINVGWRKNGTAATQRCG